MAFLRLPRDIEATSIGMETRRLLLLAGALWIVRGGSPWDRTEEWDDGMPSVIDGSAFVDRVCSCAEGVSCVTFEDGRGDLFDCFYRFGLCVVVLPESSTRSEASWASGVESVLGAMFPEGSDTHSDDVSTDDEFVATHLEQRHDGCRLPGSPPRVKVYGVWGPAFINATFGDARSAYLSLDSSRAALAQEPNPVARDDAPGGALCISGDESPAKGLAQLRKRTQERKLRDALLDRYLRVLDASAATVFVLDNWRVSHSRADVFVESNDPITTVLGGTASDDDLRAAFGEHQRARHS